MLLKLILSVVAVVIVLVAIIASRPAAFRVARSTTIDAPADVIFAQLSDFHRWLAWSPFEKVDPNLTRSFEGAPSGVGSVYHFAGNARAGEGRMTLVESQPNQRVAVRAEFIRPFTATNAIEFTLQPLPSGVSVTWSMSGSNNFMFRAFSLVMNMDRMLGKEFESGLADLKRISEEEARRHVVRDVPGSLKIRTLGVESA